MVLIYIFIYQSIHYLSLPQKTHQTNQPIRPYNFHFNQNSFPFFQDRQPIFQKLFLFMMIHMENQVILTISTDSLLSKIIIQFSVSNMNQKNNKVSDSLITRTPSTIKPTKSYFKSELILQKRIQSEPRPTNISKSHITASKTTKYGQSKYPISQKRSIDKSKLTNTYTEDPTFLKYYQQNITLKQKQQQMKIQLSKLKNQQQQKSEVKKIRQQIQLSQLASGKKSSWPTTKITPPQNKSKFSIKSTNDSNKITSLLQIIQHYKQKLSNKQQQLGAIKKQKCLLEQDIKLKQRKNDQILKNFKQSTGLQSTLELKEKIGTLNRLYQIEKQKNQFNQVQTKKLENKIKVLEFKGEEVDYLKTNNRNLEQKIFRLTQLKINNDNNGNNIGNDDRQYEEKYKTINQKYNELKTQHIKSQAELKLIKNQLISATYEADQLSKQNIKIKSHLSSNPIINQLVQDKQLLGKVVYQIKNNKKYNSSFDSITQQNYQKIIMEKQMLANQLTQLKNKIQGMQAIWKEKQKIFKNEKEDIINTLKTTTGDPTSRGLGSKIVSKDGVSYSDDVSMFSHDTINIPQNSNYFDLYLSELHLMESMISTSSNIRNPEQALILATVDFYNHNIETTRPVHGTHCNLQSEFSFKVTEDEFLVKYLNKAAFNIQIWGSEGNKRNNLGKATVDLKPLVLKNHKNLAPVINASTPIYMNRKIMGSINFVMRMRLPIFDLLQKVSECQQICSSDEQAPSRKLIIEIQEGRGFPQNSQTFVYFSFRLEDYYTKTFKGSNPTWKYYKIIDLRYNNDLKNYLRKNDLQFIIFDDNANGQSDVIGSAFIPLVPLLQSKLIQQRVTIMKGTLKVGQIDIKIYWYEQQNMKKQTIYQRQQSQQAQYLVQEDIKEYLKKYHTTIDQIFYLVDTNKTGMISFEEFYTWINKISPKFTYDAVSQFYKDFNQPVNFINFTSRFTQSTQKPEKPKNQIAHELSKINKMFEQNTEQITNKKQSFKNFLKGKQIDIVSLEIDKSMDGKISNQEIKKYFNKHNIQILPEMLNQDQINIVQFIKKYQNLP